MQSMQEQAWLIDVVHRLQRERRATCAMVACGGRTAEACCGCVFADLFQPTARLPSGYSACGHARSRPLAAVGTW